MLRGRNSGEVDVHYGQVDGTVSYQIEYAEVPVQNDAWTQKQDTYLRHLLTGLTRGKEYVVRVWAIGRGGIVVCSEEMKILVV